MKSLSIRAGQIAEASPASGEWLFADPGFASKARSCGLLESAGPPALLTFNQLRSHLVLRARTGHAPMNLVLEAPLSAAFGPTGNPIGRAIESRGGKARYWYLGVGCSVLVSAMYLLRALTEAQPTREIRLFEGFVSFKTKGIASNHCEDVTKLKKVVWGEASAGQIVPPESLVTSPDHSLVSSFLVAGMDFGVPPVIVVAEAVPG